LNPNNSWPYNSKGNILRELQRYKEAFQCYDKAIEIDPNFAKAHNCKAVALKDLEKYEEANKCFDKAIELDPNIFEAYFNKGNDYLGREKNLSIFLLKSIRKFIGLTLF